MPGTASSRNEGRGPEGGLRRTLAAPFLAVLLLAPLSAPPAGASTTVLLSDDELVDRSSLVVTGRCIETRPVHLDRRLVTLARFEVEEVLKGSHHLTGTASETVEVTVVLPGGRDPDAPFPVAEVWPGAPTLVADEEALLFLRPFQPVTDGWTTVGYSQGKFGIEWTDGTARAVQDLSGTSLQAPDGTVRPGGTRRQPLAALAHRVRQRVDASGGGR